MKKKHKTQHQPKHIGSLLILLLANLFFAQAVVAQPAAIYKRLTANDASDYDNYGYAVAISDSVAIVGSPHYNSEGGVYIYHKDQGGANNWGFVSRTVLPGGSAGDDFGSAVAISGDFAVVGIPNYGYNDQGAAAILYRHSGGTDNWGVVKTLTPTDLDNDDQFGSSVAIDGHLAIVGTDELSGTGKAYIFQKDFGGDNNWGKVKKLTASDQANGDRFGATVSIQGSVAVVGASNKDNGQGAAYVFEKNFGGADNWGQIKKLTDPQPENGTYFGNSVSVFENLLAVAAYYRDYQKGAVLLFEKDQGGTDNWGHTQIISASDGEIYDNYGKNVAIDSASLLVASVRKNAFRGAVYAYGRNYGGENNWGEKVIVMPHNQTNNDAFGQSIALSGNLALIGASGENTGQGAAYILIPPTTWNGTQWDNGEPDQTKDAIIDGDFTVGENIDHNLSCKNLIINQQATLSINPGYAIEVEEGISNQGDGSNFIFHPGASATHNSLYFFIPTATTGAPYSVTDTSVTLTATVNPDGNTAEVSFDMGTDTTYGQNYPYTGTVTGVSDVPVSQHVGNLNALTTYHYRVKVENGYCTVYGQDNYFNTATNSINELFQNKLFVHPNPTDGMVFVENQNTSPALKITVFSLAGKMIAQQKSRSKITQIDLSNQPNGIYFFRIETGKRQILHKIVKF